MVTEGDAIVGLYCNVDVVSRPEPAGTLGVWRRSGVWCVSPSPATHPPTPTPAPLALHPAHPPFREFTRLRPADGDRRGGRFGLTFLLLSRSKGSGPTRDSKGVYWISSGRPHNGREPLGSHGHWVSRPGARRDSGPGHWAGRGPLAKEDEAAAAVGARCVREWSSSLGR